MKTEITVVLPNGRHSVASLKVAIESAKKWSIKLEKEIYFFARSKKHDLEVKASFKEGRIADVRTKWHRRIVEPDENNDFYDVYQEFLQEFGLW